MDFGVKMIFSYLAHNYKPLKDIKCIFKALSSFSVFDLVSLETMRSWLESKPKGSVGLTVCFTTQQEFIMMNSSMSSAVSKRSLWGQPLFKSACWSVSGKVTQSQQVWPLRHRLFRLHHSHWRWMVTSEFSALPESTVTCLLQTLWLCHKEEWGH